MTIVTSNIQNLEIDQNDLDLQLMQLEENLQNYYETTFFRDEDIIKYINALISTNKDETKNDNLYLFAKVLNISNSSASNIINDLEDMNIVIRSSKDKNNRNKRKIMVTIGALLYAYSITRDKKYIFEIKKYIVDQKLLLIQFKGLKYGDYVYIANIRNTISNTLNIGLEFSTSTISEDLDKYIELLNTIKKQIILLPNKDLEPLINMDLFLGKAINVVLPDMFKLFKKEKTRTKIKKALTMTYNKLSRSIFKNRSSKEIQKEKLKLKILSYELEFFANYLEKNKSINEIYYDKRYQKYIEALKFQEIYWKIKEIINIKKDIIREFGLKLINVADNRGEVIIE